MRFVRPPDAIPHRERNNTYGRISESSSRLVLLSKYGRLSPTAADGAVPNGEHSFWGRTESDRLKSVPMKGRKIGNQKTFKGARTGNLGRAGPVDSRATCQQASGTKHFGN